MSKFGKVNTSSSMRAPVAKNGGAKAPEAHLKSGSANRQESTDPSRRFEPAPEVLNGAKALDSLLVFGSSTKSETMDPGRKSDGALGGGGTPLDGLMEFRVASADKRQGVGFLAEAQVRHSAATLGGLLQMGSEEMEKSLSRAQRFEPEPEDRHAATALDGLLQMGEDPKVKSLGPEHRSEPKAKVRSAANAVSVVQGFQETAKQVEDKMAELEKFLSKVVEAESGKSREETQLRDQMAPLIEAINLATTHTPLVENTLLGEGGQDLKMARGDGTVGVLMAENFSFASQGEDPGKSDGLETLLGRVRGRMSAIKEIQREMEDQLQGLARSHSEFAVRIAQDMGVDSAELNPESAALMASQVAGQMVGMTTVMLKLDLDHQAKRMAGLLRSPV